MTSLTSWASPNGQKWTVSPDAVPHLQPFFQRLNELYPQYQSLGGYANRPMRTLDGRNLGGTSTHASGFTLDIKAPDHVLKQMSQEFPAVKWGGTFKSHYDPVHFEFSPAAQPSLPKLSLLDPETGQPRSAPQADPTPPASGPKPMLLDGQPQREPTFLEGMAGRMQNPLFMGGLGMFLDAAKGGSGVSGWSAGTQASNSMLAQQKAIDEMRRAAVQREAMRKLLEDSSSDIAKSAPPLLTQLVRATGDPTPLIQHLTKHPEMQLERDKMAAQNRLLDLKAKEIEQGGKPKVMTDQTGKVIRVGGDGAVELLHDPDSVEARRRNIMSSGLDPASTQAKVYMATGKMPREDQQPLTATDKKAILEADEAVMNAEGVLRNLNEALTLSKKAYTGPTAGVRGYVGSLFGGEAGEATENLSNVVTSNALQSLKAIFGGNPTEGERKILLDIQGSANKAQHVRDEIYNRAMMLAEKRLEFYRQRAAEMRGGNYFKDPKAATAPPAEPQAPASNALPARAKPPAEAIEMLKRNTSMERRKQFDAIFGAGAADTVLRGN